MAFDMTLKMDPVKGESVTDQHPGEIDVLAWSWGASNGGTMHTSTGGGAGKVNVADITITKWVDKATCDLFKAVSNGKHFDSAVLSVRKAGGDKPVDYLIITMTDVIITNISTGASGGDDRLTESVSLNFAKVKMDYKIQDAKGVAGSGGTYGWDIAKNVAA